MCEVVGLIKLTVPDCTKPTQVHWQIRLWFKTCGNHNAPPRILHCERDEPLHGRMQHQHLSVRLCSLWWDWRVSSVLFFFSFLNKNFSFFRKYHETECGMLSPAIRLEPNVPDFQFCLAMCAGRKVFICEYNQNTGRLFWCNLVLIFCYDLFDCTT